MKKHIITAALVAGAIALVLTGCAPHAIDAGGASGNAGSSSSGDSHSGVKVPNVVGRTVADAESALTAGGLDADAGSAADDDIVTASDPAPGTTADSGSTVTLQAAPAKVDVPNVVGDTIAAAKDALAQAGLVMSAGSAGSNYKVTAQTPVAGGSVAKGTAVKLTATPPLTVSQQNAVDKAKSYLQFMAFSRSGLISQLQFDGFSAADATFGTDHSGADWNAQAIAKAKEYLTTMSFSHSGLVGQLEFDGFTAAQAEYGASKTGL